MEPSKEAIAVRLTRLNRLILGKVTSNAGSGNNAYKKAIDREALFDALCVLYDECNDDTVKKTDELVRNFVDKYRSPLAELRRTRVGLTDFDTLQVIGKGYFGDVHMVREKQTGDVYAMKTIRKDGATKQNVSSAEDEREVLSSSTSPWIPKLQYAFQDNSALYLIMELCSGGDLAALLARRGRPLAERDAAFYVAEIAHALCTLHNLGFVHRDVKPSNVLLDRCGHVKLGDFGSCARLAEGGAARGTADYVAPELLACERCHAGCLRACRGIHAECGTAGDYWSLGVVAYELVTLRRPFSAEDDTAAKILANIQQYENSGASEPPYPAELSPAPSAGWRALTGGLLRVRPSARYQYLDTLQHAALAHLSAHHIRDQPPPWVPALRGAEDAAYFPAVSRSPRVDAAPFRTRRPFGGQLPFVGFSYVAPDEGEDSTVSSGFNGSLDCTAIDLASYKSAQKLATMRAREIGALQAALAAAQTDAAGEAARARRAAEDEAERARARLQADITALTLQNKRLERQIEIDAEERMALERSVQQLTSEGRERRAQAQGALAADLERERDGLRADVRRLEARVKEMAAECERATQAADSARAQQRHYKDSIAKERALRRQTLSGCGAEAGRAAAAEAAAAAAAAREASARRDAGEAAAQAEAVCGGLQHELQEARRELADLKESSGAAARAAVAAAEELRQARAQLQRERARSDALQAAVEELQRGAAAAAAREAALEEQGARTEARLQARLAAADARAAAAAADDARHREKVQTLEQLVRQLEREVGSLEAGKAAPSDTESADGDGGGAGGRVEAGAAVLKEQLERAEKQLQARADEMAALRQEARTANLARWRKEREFENLSVEAKTSAREAKRLEERLATVSEARRTSEQKCRELQAQLDELRPQLEATTKDLEKMREETVEMKKRDEAFQVEVERSRNDILKLKSELQYAEARRQRAEQRDAASARELHALRDDTRELRAREHAHAANNAALQEACSMLEQQLSQLEALADLHEAKTRDLESETARLRSEASARAAALAAAERAGAGHAARADSAERRLADLTEAHDALLRDLTVAQERVESREQRIASLEAAAAQLEEARVSLQAAAGGAARRVAAALEDAAAARTRACEERARALRSEQAAADAKEEIAALREAAEAAAAWWRTRETKADATLRQQAKLIDFLQAKVEEAKRKKGFLGNKLFGRTGSGRRAPAAAASPPLRRANKELRDEVDRLRRELALKQNGVKDHSLNATPRSEKRRSFVRKSIDVPDSAEYKDENKLQLIWANSTERHAMTAAAADGGELSFTVAGARHRAALAAPAAAAAAGDLPRNEAARAFTIRLLEAPHSLARVVCADGAARDRWTRALAPRGYAPAVVTRAPAAPRAALRLDAGVMALGGDDGLRSLLGPIQLSAEGGAAGAAAAAGAVAALAAAAGRALLLARGALLHAPLAALTSAARRAPALRPALPVARVTLPDSAAPCLLQAITGEAGHGACAVVACGRRVFLLRFDAASAEFRVTRSLTVDRAPAAALLTAQAVYIAGEKPLKVGLPSGALETFGADEPLVSAAAKRRSPPRALLLTRAEPAELLVCYAEGGVFLDAAGRRTRSDDPKWPLAPETFAFVRPFLYAAGPEGVAVLHVADDAYRSPPCTCDAQSLASSDGCAPATLTLRLEDAAIVGTVPEGVIVSYKVDGEYAVAVVDGVAALRSVGASVESLATTADPAGSCGDLARSSSDASQRSSDVSEASVEPHTNFLADIRRRAQIIREKSRHEEAREARRSSRQKRADATDETDSDSDAPAPAAARTPADVCAEMFARQVRFQ